MTHEWFIEGDYVEACNCDVACQCIWLDPPNDDACTASLAWHIQDGRYGGVELSGLHAAMLIRSEEGVMFDPDVAWHVVLLVDESASDEQRAALEAIYSGRAGGVFAAVADTHIESAEIASAPFSFTRSGDDFTVEIGDVSTVEVVGKSGFGEEPVTISPHPLTKSREMQLGESTTATVSYDDEFAWDLSETNSYYCDFKLANA